MSDSDYMDTTPVREPPEGQVSNLVDPVSRAYQLEIVIGVMTALVTISMLLRIYCRLKIAPASGADDWLCLIATIFTLAYSALVLTLLDKPGGGVIGIHLWDVSLSKFIQYTKGSLADAVLIRITNTLIKLAFFTFYLRLFWAYTHIRIMIWVGMVVVTTFCAAFVITDLVACSPWPGEEGGWMDPALMSRCNTLATNLVTAGAYFSVITDFYLLFIPLQLVPKLNLSLKRKFGFSFIFLTGLLATGAGLANVIIRADKSIFDHSDYSWTIVPVYITSILEINLGVICHSMPVISGVFVGRITALSKDWRVLLEERRARRCGLNGSSANLAPNRLDALSPPQLSQSTPTGTLTWVRKYIQDVYRSATGSSHRDSTAVDTNNGPSTPVMDYHEFLRTENSRANLKQGSEMA